MRARRRRAARKGSAWAQSVLRYWRNHEPSDNPRAYMTDGGWLRWY